MKSLFVRKLFLWPRFHASVMSSLDKHKVHYVGMSLLVMNLNLAYHDYNFHNHDTDTRYSIFLANSIQVNA